MTETIENIELRKFLESLMQDVRTIQVSDEEGGILEQVFTKYAIDLLTDAGETENVRTVYDEKALGTKNQHKINAYSISDNYETVDLFITIFKASLEPIKIGKDEIETASKRILNFLRKGLYKNYVNDIEESSPIFDFVSTLSKSTDLKENLVRINAIILTDGHYSGEFPPTQTLSEYPIFFRIVDLNYLYNISIKPHIPIEIDFISEGFDVPCILAPSYNDQYQSYLAIIPGPALALIYERYGSRLLEQNVRSFLQFTGKINKGIRSTIIKEPHMFLAFNNGLAVTAEEVEFSQSNNGKGISIAKVRDFQIVNGGQTTASIYHTLKKDKADISKIHVQLKLSVVKNKQEFSEIVSRISEYANTQNKVSVSDLSSNKPYHIALEKLSRTIYTPHIAGRTSQTKWFYERARGQYKNARLKEGFTKAKQNAFDLKNPRKQVFTKEDLAKYINAYQEVYEGKKLVIGPHFVVRGNQKNYVQFINYNFVKLINNIYYEDLIAKAILYKRAEELYGIKPNSIGDMRYITVPYSISLFNFKLGYKLDLYKIWKNQDLSQEVKQSIYQLMIQVEDFIKNNAPGSLYGEWAKKEECWNKLKEQNLGNDLLRTLQKELVNAEHATRQIVEINSVESQIKEDLDKIKSVPAEVWKQFIDWGKTTDSLNQYERDMSFTIAGRLKGGSEIIEFERRAGIRILDKVLESAPELLFNIEEIAVTPPENKVDHLEISIDLLKKILKWDRENKRLKDFEYKFLLKLSDGRNTMTERNKMLAYKALEKVRKYGFNE